MDPKYKKVILQPIDATKKEKPEKVVKEKSKRVVTQSKQWQFCEQDFLPENQTQLLQQVLFLQNNDLKKETTEKENLQKTTVLLQQLHKKIYGYKTQDLEKSLYVPTEFIDEAYVLQKLADEPCCFYCRQPVQLIYEFVREPLQWTLDRIDNTRGHNRDNVEIACLRCNLRRRVMHHEKFVFTKQLVIKKQG